MDEPAYPPGPEGGDDAVVPTAGDDTAGGLERRWWGRLLVRGLPVLFVASMAFFGVQVFSADDGVVILGYRDVVVDPDRNRVEVGVIEGTVRVVVPEGVQASISREWSGGRISCGDACRRPGRAVIVHLIGTGRVDVLTTEELAVEKAAEGARGG